MKKFLLIDGFSILFRAFYGMPLSMTAPDGRHTNAVYGFLAILNKVIEDEKPDYIAVAFDRPEKTFRHELYPEYKGNRGEAPDEFHEQVPMIKELLSDMNISTVSLAGYEADDILGTLSMKAAGEGLDVTVVSGDRDLLQIVTDGIKVVVPKTHAGKTVYENYGPKDVEEKYGVTPEGFIELKALMGDSSDNIPGLPGVGPKTAAKILSEFGTIENAKNHVDEIKPKKAMEAMRDHGELLDLSKELVTIKKDAPVEFLEDFAVGEFYGAKTIDKFRTLGFKSLVKKYAGEVKEDEWQGVDDSAIPAKLMESGEQEEKSDIEIPECDRTPVVNAKEYLKAKYPKGSIPVEEADKLFDVSIAAYLIDPLKSDWDYDTIAAGYLSTNLPTRKELEKTVEDTKERAEKIKEYEEKVAGAAMPILWKKLVEEDMAKLFTDIEMPLTAVLAGMETEGILCDRDELARYGKTLGERIEELESDIRSEAGEDFNLNSPKQLSHILFEKLMIPGGKKTKTGYSTAADVLEKLAPEYPIVEKILEYRTYAKLKSTYADGLGTYIEEDGRIRTTFNQTITATGRLSSTDPNLQNIPMRIELGRLIRKSFYPAPDCVFVDADYSQIELRVLAHMSEDEKLIEAYRQEKDIHRTTASQVFHVPFEDVTDLMRRNAKAVNFGIVYGMSAFGLSQGLSITPKEAATYIEKYFATYPKIKEFLDSQVASAKETGYAKTIFGRKRPIPELKETNFARRSFGERVAMNAPIQGSAADIMKLAMIRVEKRLRMENLSSRMILQIHDEILIEAKKSEAKLVEKILIEEMERAAELKVKLEVDCHTGENWYEAK